MRNLATLLLFGALCRPAMAQQARSWNAAEVAKLLGSLPERPPTNREILTEPHYAVKVARIDNRNGPVEIHRAQDRIFLVVSGSASLRIGGTPVAPREIAPGEFQASNSRGSRSIAMLPGTIVSVPRGVPYQIVAAGSKMEFFVVRVF